MQLPANRDTAVSTEPVNAGDAKPITVLLADDHQPILDRVAALVSGEFTVVAAVSSSEEAIDASARLHPKVLVLDVSMPGLNGFEAASRVRNAGSSCWSSSF